MHSYLTNILVGCALVIPSAAVADFKLPAPSPQSTVSQQIGVTDVSVSYSSPGVKERTVFGELVPYGEVWRTGANSCTTFKTEDEVTVGGKNLPAGEYCLFTIPNKDSWTVIFNKDKRQFAAIDYDKTKDVLRVSASPEKTDFRERMTFLFENVTDSQADLVLEWEKTLVRLPIQTDTKKLAMQKIRSLNSDSYWDYLSAARHLKDKEKDLNLALQMIDKSIAKEKTWFNTYVKGDILAAKGDFAKATQYANEAMKLKDESPLYTFFGPRIEKDSKEWSSKVNG
ncbi:MAG: DUF2911 domain-containing protein [Bdellovibrionales bacterium]|nr:DUF2911 domain-containing protein [Bdellovibrionales bacterium]